MKRQPKKKNRLKFRFFLDKNPCIDEYAGSYVIGIFLPSGYCLAGVMLQPPHQQCPATREGEAYGLVLFNHAAGIWRDPDPHLPWSGGLR